MVSASERLDRDALAGKADGDARARVVKGLQHGVEGDSQILVGMDGFDLGNGGDESGVPYRGIAGDLRMQVVDHVPQFGCRDQGAYL